MDLQADRKLDNIDFNIQFRYFILFPGCDFIYTAGRNFSSFIICGCNYSGINSGCNYKRNRNVPFEQIY